MAEEISGMFVLEGNAEGEDVHVAAFALSLADWERFARLLMCAEEATGEGNHIAERDMCRKVIGMAASCLRQQGIDAVKGADGKTHLMHVDKLWPMAGPVGHA
jgi:hypothetical protein